MKMRLIVGNQSVEGSGSNRDSGKVMLQVTPIMM